MPIPQSSDAFRREAKAMYRGIVAGLLVIVGCMAGVGWLLAHWWGLLMGGVIGVVVLIVGLFGATFFYAMSQDGA